MRRRAFLALCGSSAMARPLGVHAQQPKRTYRIGILSTQRRPSEPALLQALAARGYVEGRNSIIMSRSADGEYERAGVLAAELVGLKPDVIIAAGGVAAEALTRATTTIPIVLWEVGDPAGLGITNYAHPARNVTGVTELSTELSAKRLQLLKEAVPEAVRVALLWNTTDKSMELRAQALSVSAPNLGITIVPLPVHNPEEIDDALVQLTKNPADAVIVVTDPLIGRKQQATIDFLTAHRLPSMYEYPGAAKNGALLSYGPNFADLAPIAADYVDRILKGAKSDDLPIQGPTRLYLWINAKAAGDLGITIPPALMLRADEVIE